MAYMTKETAAKIRKALKDEFGKTVKFSVTIAHHSTLNVSIMQSPFFGDGEYSQVNQYWLEDHYKDQPEQLAVLKKIKEIILTVGEYWDESDIMTDYFHTAFYYNISVGKWNKKHINSGAV